LVAIVLAQLLSLNRVDQIDRFEFRARSPLYVNQPIQVVGKPERDHVELRALGPSGMLAMHATAWLAGRRP
jgi:hydroxyacyl-ACP dehydratase HTD2-like protein with hotdog domain